MRFWPFGGEGGMSLQKQTNTQSKTTFEILYQNVRDTRSKQTEPYGDAYSMDFQIIFLRQGYVTCVSITNYFQILSLSCILIGSVAVF
jgi:hypothetical protein